ncbi:MAG: hypothetical protein K5873_11750 [Treponema sp.]|nr:hypothetical protein [Treponema sp.]
MIKTYEIDLDDSLVETACKVFEEKGSDIDSAIKAFLEETVKAQGLSIAEEKCNLNKENSPETEPVQEESSDIHGGVSEEEESAFATVTVDPAIAERVAANEALVAQMRGEIGEQSLVPEFDENEDDGTQGDYDSGPEKQSPSEEESKPDSEEISQEEVSSEKEASSENDDDEDEDETAPENLFDAWA